MTLSPGLAARKDQVDLLRVDALLCQGRHSGREREGRSSGSPRVRPMTPNACGLRSVSRCHSGWRGAAAAPGSTCGKPGQQPRGSAWNAVCIRRTGVGGRVCVGILGDWLCPEISVYLGWKRSSPLMAWPRMLMSQGKGTEFDCVSHRTGNGLSA